MLGAACPMIFEGKSSVVYNSRGHVGKDRVIEVRNAWHRDSRSNGTKNAVDGSGLVVPMVTNSADQQAVGLWCPIHKRRIASFVSWSTSDPRRLRVGAFRWVGAHQ